VRRFDTPRVLAGFVPSAAFTDDWGRVWFGSEAGTIFYLDGGTIHPVASAQDSPIGAVRAIQGRNHHVWAGGSSGLAYFDGNRLRSVAPASADSFEAVTGIQEIADGSLWILERRGVIHIQAAEVRRFLQAPAHHASYQLFDADDGLPGPISDRGGQKEIEDGNGRLWFVTRNGCVAWVDPRDVEARPPAAPALFQSIAADGQTYVRRMDLQLRAGIRSLEIHYSAPNLSYPLRTVFRYKLDGVDAQWQDAGPRRTAFYTELHPRSYQFHVIAGDTEGDWNDDAAVASFTVPPFWYQTQWFHLLGGVVVLLAFWMMYRLRVLQLQRQFTLALGTRVDERIRIARELHDTLLQSFHGLMFRFQAARNMLPRRPEPAMQVLDEAIIATEQALTEGRDAIRDLRPEAAAQRDLAGLLSDVEQEMADAQAGRESPPGFRVIVEGKPRKLSSALQDELYRIGREVIRNAFHHAAAGHIEAEILYDERQLRLRIRDDGKGIDARDLEAAGCPGHWGLPGIRERAQRIGARLEFWSEAGAGTEVELMVPAALAYEKERAGHRFGWFARRKRQERPVLR
jgi:signal transduction histidine kinase